MSQSRGQKEMFYFLIFKLMLLKTENFLSADVNLYLNHNNKKDYSSQPKTTLDLRIDDF